MIPYRPNILSDLPPALDKRLKLIEALAKHTAQDHRAASANTRSGPTIRETYPELAALWQWLTLKYSPDQPRVPAGNRDGGQWTRGEGGSGSDSLAPANSSTTPTDAFVISAANRPVQLASLETATMTGTPTVSNGQSALSNSELSRPDQELAAIRVSPQQEAECDAQFERDIFHCNMVGLPACREQAMLRYSNCLSGRPIPPLNY